MKKGRTTSVRPLCKQKAPERNWLRFRQQLERRQRLEQLQQLVLLGLPRLLRQVLRDARARGARALRYFQQLGTTQQELQHSTVLQLVQKHSNLLLVQHSTCCVDRSDEHDTLELVRRSILARERKLVLCSKVPELALVRSMALVPHKELDSNGWLDAQRTLRVDEQTTLVAGMGPGSKPVLARVHSKQVQVHKQVLHHSNQRHDGPKARHPHLQ